MVIRPGVFRPSRVLGLLLFAVIGFFAGFIRWQLDLRDQTLVLQAAQWVVVVAAFAAVIGWLTNSIVTIRNSVKQHTVNTLLQSRLSAAYMDKASKVNAALSGAGGITNPVTAPQVAAGDPVVADLMYFLNYFEFIAVGVRHGDLDEDLMRGSVRGFVHNLYAASEEVVRAYTRDARTLEHLKWLRRRWADGSRAAVYELVGLTAVLCSALFIAAWATPQLLDSLARAQRYADAATGRHLDRVSNSPRSADSSSAPALPALSSSHLPSTETESSVSWDPTILAMAAGLALMAAGAGVALFGYYSRRAVAGVVGLLGFLMFSAGAITRMNVTGNLNLTFKPDALIKIIQQQVQETTAPGPERLAVVDRYLLGDSAYILDSEGRRIAAAEAPGVERVAKMWLQRRQENRDGVLLVIGGTDRVRLGATLGRQYEANVGLAQSRGEVVKQAIIRRCEQLDRSCNLSTERVIVLVAGPRETPAVAGVSDASDGSPTDRRVDVWALWTRKDEKALPR